MRIQFPWLWHGLPTVPRPPTEGLLRSGLEAGGPVVEAGDLRSKTVARSGDRATTGGRPCHNRGPCYNRTDPRFRHKSKIINWLRQIRDHSGARCRSHPTWQRAHSTQPHEKQGFTIVVNRCHPSLRAAKRGNTPFARRKIGKRRNWRRNGCVG
jgi:hypothetical protein